MPGVSPLTAGYNQWVAGRSIGPGLPRPFTDFLAGAFGPLSPLTPMPIDEPQESGRPYPRRWQYPVGWNLPVGQPGADGMKMVSFATMRQYADIYSVVRAMLNIRINEMAGMNWDIGPTPDAQSNTKGDKGASKDQHDRAAMIVEWFKRIDPDYYGFQSWFTALLEDMFVIDAVSLHLHPTRVDGAGLFGSSVAALTAINGETIRPLVDIYGSTPRPPAPAYQQYLWGVPRADLSTIIRDADMDEMQQRLKDAGYPKDAHPEQEYSADQLMYLPRWRRTWTPYGFSSIEQAVLPMSIGLKRQEFLLDYFTEGTIPGVYVIAGEQMVTPAQQRQLQDSLNALAGDVAWKHRVIVLPPGSKTDSQKDLAWQAQVDQTIVEQVAMILHIQMQEISMLPGGKSSGLGGKGMAEAQQDSVAETRTQPDRKWYKETLFDWVIQQLLGQKDLEWKWVDFQEEEEEDKKAAAEAAMIQAGKISIDEARIEDGLDPWSTPFTQKPFLVVNNQLVSLDPTIAPYPATPTPAPSPFGGPPPAAPGAKPPFGGPKDTAGSKDPFAPKPGQLGPGGTQGPPQDAKPAAKPGQPAAKPGQPAAKPGQPGAKPGQPGQPGQAPVGPDGQPLPPPRPEQKVKPGQVATDENNQTLGHDGKPIKPGEQPLATPHALPPGQRSAIDIAVEQAKDQPPGSSDASKPLGATKPTTKPTTKPAKTKKVTVADLVKGKVKYKGDLHDVVYQYLLRSYPGKDVEWVLDPDIEWEFDPHVPLSDINMARRPGGRDPKKVTDISDTLGKGASMDPIVLVDLNNPNGYVIGDGWHRTLGAEDAGWDDVPAFIGTHVPEQYGTLITGAMQNDSDSKKAAIGELGVLRRYLRKGGDITKFAARSVAPSVIESIRDMVLSGDDLNAVMGVAREAIFKASGNVEGLTSWYVDGADGAISWGDPGDFDQCVSVASKYMTEEQAAGFCNLRHQEATGMSTSEHAHEDAVKSESARQVASDRHAYPTLAITGPRSPVLTDTPLPTGKTISLSGPLSTGFVPFDLAGAEPSPGNRCAKCGGDMADGKCMKCGALVEPDTTKLLAAIEAELARRGVDLAKYSEAEARDDHGRWSSGGGGGDPVAAVLAGAEQGGWSVHPYRATSPTTGYQVAMKGRTTMLDESILSDKQALAEKITSFIESNKDVLTPGGHVYIGGWTDSGKVYLEPSERVSSRADAVRMGTERNQISIWDNVRHEEIPTGGTGEA